MADLTWCEQLGYYEGDLFVIKEPLKGYCRLAPGALVRLEKDDDTPAPYFRVLMGFCKELGTDLTGEEIVLYARDDVEKLESDVGPNTQEDDHERE